MVRQGTCSNLPSRISIVSNNENQGVVIHEMSHFRTTAETNDYAYGQGACQALADSNPHKAINNADSHKYLAENPSALACNPSQAEAEY